MAIMLGLKTREIKSFIHRLFTLKNNAIVLSSRWKAGHFYVKIWNTEDLLCLNNVMKLKKNTSGI